MDSAGSEYDSMADSCHHGNEAFGVTKGWVGVRSVSERRSCCMVYSTRVLEYEQRQIFF
jgi:hypothetical protein